MQNTYTWGNRRHFIASVAALGLCPLVQAAPTAHVLVLGDSLSAEYGLARGSGWVALLAQKLRAEKHLATITNASISGDTTSGGRSRLPALLQQHAPSVVVIALGGNDALRGLPLAGTLDNLRAMTAAAQKTGAKVLLLGMQMPPNYGKQYTQDFEQLFSQVAQERNAALVPSLLKGVADAADPTALFQSDRIHPTAPAQPIMLGNVWRELQPLLRP